MPLGNYLYDLLSGDALYPDPLLSPTPSLSPSPPPPPPPPPAIESPLPQPHLPVRPDAAARQTVLRRALRGVMPPPLPDTSIATIDSESDDDLVEIVSARTSRPSSTVPQAPPPQPPSLMLPRPGGRLLPADMAESRWRAAAAPSTRASRQAAHRQGDTVIDLTEEPDSPVEVRSLQAMLGNGPARLPPIRTHRHPRRTNSQRASPPRLSRSESIMLASQTSFIDLTGDDDNNNNHTTSPTTTSNRSLHRTINLNNSHTTPSNHEPPVTRGANRRSNRNHHLPMLPPHQHTFTSDHLVDYEFLNPNHTARYNFASNLARGFGRTLADMLSTGIFQSPENPRPTAGQPHHHHTPGGGNGGGGGGFSMHSFPPHRFQRPPSPRREMPPLPPTRPGFTRDTCAEPAADEERVVICPSCGEELAYDPNDTTTSQSTTATGAKKRKRTVGDHHFWAVKKCGHVYCAECFENRRPTKSAPDGVGFRGPPGKSPNQAPNDLRCAVDGCETKVANKTEWVGIFL